MSSAISERSDPLVGLSFYDFVVERKLAQGGMGAVYLLRHQQYPIRKVLKVILPRYADHPAIRERFEREAHAVASLRHPNIGKIDSVGTINGQPCMLIPFLEGEPLDAYLAARGGQLRPHEVLHIATQIARALHYAHGESVIHRDLKPGSVFVEPTEDDPLAIQVLDFGIAKQLKNSEPSFGTSGPLGTPEYMAVEQFEHASDVTPAADVWALAIMIAAGPSTLPISSAPPAVPAWSPGTEHGPPVGGSTSAPPGRSTVTRQPAGAPPFLADPGPAMSTTLGSSTGVIAPRSPTPSRRKLALLGSTAAVLSAAAILTISSIGGHREPATGTPAAPTPGASTPEASSTTRPIAPAQRETRPTAPSEPSPRAADLTSAPPANSLTPAVPSPSARRATPEAEQPAVGVRCARTP